MSSLKRIILFLILSILILTTISAVVFWYNWHKNGPAEISSVVVNPQEIFVGESTKISIVVSTPWYRQVKLPIISSKEQDAIITDNTSIKKSFSSSGNEWKIDAQLVVFTEGELNDLYLKMPLSTDRENKQKELLVKLPKLTVKTAGFSDRSLVDYKKELQKSDLTFQSSELKEEKNKWLIPIILTIIIVIALLIYIYIRKNKKLQLTPEQMAIKDLQNLKVEKNITDELFFVRLSDILRLYIEKRFSLPATEKTSEEFILQLREGNQLISEHRAALEDFLQVADLVKFAKMSASEKQRLDCLAMAEKFVTETTVQQNEVRK